jgi:Leucine-rich repeat (LRR) protein
MYTFLLYRMYEVPACLYDMKKLEIIIAADNKIATLNTDKLSDLKRLSVLDLRNNNLPQLPPELGKMTHLRSLLVEGNAFRVPGYQILSQGTDNLLQYLRNRIVVN